MFTPKHYEKIASELRYMQYTFKASKNEAMFDFLVCKFITMFKGDNFKFDETKFRQAIYD